MRQPEYLSPTAIGEFLRSPEGYYSKYLADHRPPREPQTQPMSVGSSFDAHVKAYIQLALYGDVGKFSFVKLFETQVEKHNRDWALEAGENCFKQYKKSGALADLMLNLQGAQCDPRMEFEVRANIQGIILLGRPDLYFIHKKGARVVCDWKVNGYCSKSAVSPKKGFLRCRDGWDHDIYKMSRGHDAAHKDCAPLLHHGIMINGSMHLEDIDASWARQQAIYAWLLGEDIGSDFIASIEQLACKPNKDFPLIRIASHRCRISEEFQHGFLGVAKNLWERIRSKWIFTDLTHEESTRRQELLDQEGKILDESPEWFRELSK